MSKMELASTIRPEEVNLLGENTYLHGKYIIPVCVCVYELIASSKSCLPSDNKLKVYSISLTSTSF